VPGDGLALAIRIGRQDQLFGALGRLGDFLDPGGAAAFDFPGDGEVFLRPHRPVLRGQVADMAEGGQHLIIGAKILVDGLGFGRGFDDDDFHGLLRSALQTAALNFCRAPKMGASSGLHQQGDPVSRMPFEPARQVQFQQHHAQNGGRAMTLPDQFVNHHRAGA
jgi:hypothetical protein